MFNRYPLPKDRHSILTTVELIKERCGPPQESWLNYWRSDADLNYHHRYISYI